MKVGWVVVHCTGQRKAAAAAAVGSRTTDKSTDLLTDFSK